MKRSFEPHAAVAGLNYRVLATQRSIGAYMHAHPWLGLIPGIALLFLVHAMFWMAYTAVLIATPVLLGSRVVCDWARRDRLSS